MTQTVNPIAASRTQASTSAVTGGNAVTSAEGSSGFINYMLMQLGTLNIPSDKMDAITNDIKNAAKNGASPALGLLKQIAGQVSLEAEGGLSEGNEMFLKDIAGMFVSMHKEGEISLSSETIGKLEAIASGDVPAAEFLNLLDKEGLLAELEISPSSKDNAGDNDVNTIDDDYADIDEEDVVGLGKFLDRLHAIQERVQERIAALDGQPKAKDAMEKLSQHISKLIAGVETKIDQKQATNTSNGIPAPEIGLKADGDERTRVSRRQMLRSDAAAQAGSDAKAKPDTASKGNSQAQAASQGNADKTAQSGKGFSLDPNGIGDKGFKSDAALSTDANADGRMTATLKSVASGSSATTASQRSLLPPSPAAQQVLVHIQRNAGNSSKMSIKLSPAELGRVDVNLSMDKDGKTKATIVVDRVETLQLLQKDAGHLERALQSAGLQASAQDLNFSLREHQQNNANAGKSGSGNGNNSIDGTEDGTNLATHEIDPAIFGEYRVDYKA